LINKEAFGDEGLNDNFFLNNFRLRPVKIRIDFEDSS
jgi:hypothetical protein